mmetsp:Transcript_9236/g.24272  ORF Transcript_9236/g.24272 Transcript_9236/m.24272 type:complete len:269 (+) Transcript_9236:719-1525(+)
MQSGGGRQDCTHAGVTRPRDAVTHPVVQIFCLCQSALTKVREARDENPRRRRVARHAFSPSHAVVAIGSCRRFRATRRCSESASAVLLTPHRDHRLEQSRRLSCIRGRWRLCCGGWARRHKGSCRRVAAMQRSKVVCRLPFAYKVEAKTTGDRIRKLLHSIASADSRVFFSRGTFVKLQEIPKFRWEERHHALWNLVNRATVKPQLRPRPLSRCTQVCPQPEVCEMSLHMLARMKALLDATAGEPQVLQHGPEASNLHAIFRKGVRQL